ncbi:bifunctional methylenetetrahydrofolate dehydrogenase/methenyltetrahydrofolate cyclohydrolase [Patescibacteria group bacterium]|nr:MAG: bifunctional methylenetetrahydrofolate dehydrogenase/methenyltetrahydrofolate cyclohydrolase [Patescibacteria group bacterium]
MSGQILEGISLRDATIQRLSARVKTLSAQPTLVVVQIGDRADSVAYIKAKKSFGEKIGARVIHEMLPEKVSSDAVVSCIKKHNTDHSVHGIIVQLPLPVHLDQHTILEAIDPKKDVDGLTSTHTQELWEDGSEIVLPATTRGILSLLDCYQIPVEGKKVVIVGRSVLVGKPTAMAFLNRNATVTICHRGTQNLSEETLRADILIVAIGKPHFITKDFVREGQVVIDVGINTLADGKLQEEVGKRKLVGDVDFENVSKIVSAISPVPGGVGAMTVASLFENLLDLTGE